MSGSLTTLNIFNLITGSANFAISESTVNVAFNGSGPADLTNATLLQIGLSGLMGSVSSGGVGVSVTGGNLGIAAVEPANPGADGREWVAVYGTGLAASLNLGSAISATVTGASVQINQASGKGADGAPAVALNWAADLEATGTTSFGLAVNPGSLLPSPPTPPDLTIPFTGALLALSGSLTNLSVFNVLNGSADFALSKTSANVSLGGTTLTGATLITLALSNLQAGTAAGGFGVAVTGGTIGLAVLEAPTPVAMGATDGRTWTAVVATGLSANLSLTTNITAAVAGMTVAINQASGKYTAGGVSTLAAPLNWTTALDLNGDGQFGTAADQVDPGQGLPNPVALPIAFTVGQLAMAGTLTNLNIFNVISGSAGFALSESTVGAKLPDHSTLMGATLVTLALDNISAAAGAGGFGVAITGGTLGLALLEPSPTDGRYWVAVIGSNLSAGLTLGASVSAAVSNLSVSINQAEAGTTALDWGADLDLDNDGQYGTASDQVNPGANLPTPVSLPITFAAAELAMSGSLTSLNIFNLITGSANFALSDTTASVTTGGSTLAGATLITLGLSNLQAGVGAGGFGLTINGGNLGLAVIEAPTPATGTDSRYWIDVVGNGLSASLSLGGISATATGVTLQLNQAGGQDAGGNPAVALNWQTQVSGPTLPINPGANLSPPVSLPITDTAPAFSIGATTASFNIFNLFTGSASFVLSRSTMNISFTASGNPSLVGASLLQLSLGNLNLSLGVSSFGLTITGGTIGIAVLEAPTPASGSDSRYWTAVDASGLTATLSLGSSFSATVSKLAVQINKAGGSYVNGSVTVAASPLDWNDDLQTPGTTTYGAKVNPGAGLPGPVDLTITYTGPVLSVSGSLSGINLFNLIVGSADFAISLTTTNIAFAGTGKADLVGATLITLALSNLNVMVGTAGVGLAITSGDLGIAAIEAPQVGQR